MNSLKKYKVTFKDGKSEVAEDKVFLFSESNALVPVATNLNVYNANLVQSIKEVKQEVCTEEHEGVALTKIEKAIALSIIFNAIDNKELDGHVSKEKLSDVLKVFEALKEEIDADKELEEEKEAHLNIINKLIDNILAEKNQGQKELSPPFQK
ncbi:TPA: hypothetical protein QCN67_005570 [Bacillus thuringiensis]|nr:hypothetical protein SD98_06255 [Bacillus thuringiensis serovar morrisoni]MRA99854.1 hypothetical protein [Bacillus thuringiensis]OTY44373.1 hypothetical protein BK736_05290 [Bacillus thuringiensis serovar poloniensis]NUW51473.1 hypothetical protein [Bacillus thuringiensis]UEL01394.1 hypothetical protein K8Z23_30720 [Bacillus thuringiensis]